MRIFGVFLIVGAVGLFAVESGTDLYVFRAAGPPSGAPLIREFIHYAVWQAYTWSLLCSWLMLGLGISLCVPWRKRKEDVDSSGLR